MSRFTGKLLTYAQLQGLFLGQALNSDAVGNFTASLEGGLHKLSAIEKEELQSTYFFEDKNTLLKKEEITEAHSQRKIVISYPLLAEN